MRYPSSQQARYVKLINRSGALARRMGYRGQPMTPEALMAAAMRRTGLEDFGDPDFRSGLAHLLDALESEVQLSTLGRMATRQMLEENLAHRLRRVTYRKQHPELSALVHGPGHGAHLPLAPPFPPAHAVRHGAGTLGAEDAAPHGLHRSPACGVSRCLPGADPSDPMAAIERLYAHFDFEFTPEARLAMERYLAQRPREKHGVHRYTLEEFGLGKASHGGLFEDYCRRFGL